MFKSMIPVVSAVAILAACGPAGAAPRKPARVDMKILLLTSGGLASIPETPCAGTAGSPVTMKIGPLLAELVNGSIARDIHNAKGNSVGRPASVGNNWPTNLDMQVNETGVSNDYVMVTVDLMVVRGVNFLRQPGAAVDDSRSAVMIDPSTVAAFCGRTKVGLNGNRQSVSFGVRKGADVRAFNIGIMIPDRPASPTYWQPLFLDPNVKNDG